MEKLEKVEMLRAKTGVTYEEAKNALEACEYDTLDAIVYLEKLGKIVAPQNSVYVTAPADGTSAEFQKAQATYQKDCKKSKFGDAMSNFFAWCGRVAKKGMECSLQIDRNDQKVASIPVLVFVLLVLCAFWVTIPLLVIGIFFDFRYHFVGVDKITIDLNDVCEKAADTCENIKTEITSEKKESV